MPKRRSTFQPTPGYTTLDLIAGSVFCVLVIVVCVASIWSMVSR